ncbi:MAG: acyl carrier protein [Bacteroidota bacterium]
MSITKAAIGEKVRTYVLQEYYDGESSELTDDLPLVSSGLIDSISILQMVEFLEQSFNFEFLPHEVDEENLNSIQQIVEFVSTKQAA